MKKIINVFEVTIVYTSAKPSLYEVWEEIHNFTKIPLRVDIKYIDELGLTEVKTE